jgi:DnaJ-class molecular chaperone
MASRDYYDILGVSRSASTEEIKRAYHKLARKFHPDLHPGDKDAEKKFKEVQEAYEILSDPQKREQYDRFGSAAFEHGGAGPRGRTYRWSTQGGPNIEFDFSDLGDLFSHAFGGRAGGGTTGFRTAFPGEDVETEITVPFRTAICGGEVDVSVSTMGRHRLTLTIPRGTHDGARLRLAGKGEASPAGGPRGDLYVVVRVEPHPYFVRKGDDLYVEVPITVAEAILGANIDVPSLDGMISVTVPPGTSSGKKLRLRGKGGPKPTGGFGDLFVQIRIMVPDRVDSEGRRMIEEFGRRHPYNPRKEMGW